MNKKNILMTLQVMAVYMGCVIGAGFASGREILQFFILQGEKGLWGAALAAVLFSYTGGLMVWLSVKYKTTNYKNFLNAVLGRQASRLMDWIGLLMLPGGLLVMLAGSGAVFSEHLGLPSAVGVALTSIITVATITGGLRGVVAANSLLVPVKISAIMLICLLALGAGGPTAPPAPLVSDPGHWAWQAVLYVSYNMIVPMAVLSTYGNSIYRVPGIAGGILGGAVLGLIILLVTFTGLHYLPEIAAYEIPLLYIASKINHHLRLLIGVLVWVAILTTAIGNAHGFSSRLFRPGSPQYKICGAALVAALLPLAGLKFSSLVQVLYPAFGYASLLLLLGILIAIPRQVLKRKLSNYL